MTHSPDRLDQLAEQLTTAREALAVASELVAELRTERRDLAGATPSPVEAVRDQLNQLPAGANRGHAREALAVVVDAIATAQRVRELAAPFATTSN